MDNILKLSDLTANDVKMIIRHAADLKKRIKQGEKFTSLSGKVVGLLFNKPSTRTRLSFESACAQLGGTPVFMAMQDTQIARDEPIKDTARVFSLFLDAVAVRTYSQANLEELAQYSNIPVINALTDDFHPCQILSDWMTVTEILGAAAQNAKIVWIGDGNNVAQSWINLAGVLGLELILACPQGYFPRKDLVDAANAKGAKVSVTTDPVAAVKNADVINTDVWASMGQESEAEARKKVFAPYQVNADLVAHAKGSAIVLHCLPAHRGEEITADVLEGAQSVVWQQAENKMHLHRAVLDLLIKDKKDNPGIRADGGKCDQWCDA